MLQHVWVEGAGLDVGPISSLTLDVQPIGLINGATCGSGVRNATPSPTLYLRSDE